MDRRTSQLPTLPFDEEGVHGYPYMMPPSGFDNRLLPHNFASNDPTPDPTPGSPVFDAYPFPPPMPMDRPKVSFNDARLPTPLDRAPQPQSEPAYAGQGFAMVSCAVRAPQQYAPPQQQRENGTPSQQKPPHPFKLETEMHHLVRYWMWEKFRAKLKKMKLPDDVLQALMRLSETQPLRALTSAALKQRLEQKGCAKGFTAEDARGCMRAVLQILFNVDTYVFSLEKGKTENQWKRIDFGTRGTIWPSIRKEMFWPTDGPTFYQEYGISLSELEDGLGSDEFRKAVTEFKMAYFFGITEDKLLSMTPYIQSLVGSSISAEDPRAQMKEILTKNNEGYGTVAGLILTIAVGNILMNNYYGTIGNRGANIAMITASISFISALLCALISADNLVQITQCPDESILWFAMFAFNCWWFSDGGSYIDRNGKKKKRPLASRIAGGVNNFFHPFYQLANSILFLGISVWNAFTVFRVDIGKHTTAGDKTTDCDKVWAAHGVLYVIAMIFNGSLLLFLVRKILISCLFRMASNNVQTLRIKSLEKWQKLEMSQRASVLKSFNEEAKKKHALETAAFYGSDVNPEEVNNHGSSDDSDSDDWSDFSRVDDGDEDVGGGGGGEAKVKLDEGALINEKYEEDKNSCKDARSSLWNDMFVGFVVFFASMFFALYAILSISNGNCHTGSLSRTTTVTLTPTLTLTQMFRK